MFNIMLTNEFNPLMASEKIFGSERLFGFPRRSLKSQGEIIVSINHVLDTEYSVPCIEDVLIVQFDGCDIVPEWSQNNQMGSYRVITTVAEPSLGP